MSELTKAEEEFSTTFWKHTASCAHCLDYFKRQKPGRKLKEFRVIMPELCPKAQELWADAQKKGVK